MQCHMRSDFWHVLKTRKPEWKSKNRSFKRFENRQGEGQWRLAGSEAEARWGWCRRGIITYCRVLVSSNNLVTSDVGAVLFDNGQPPIDRLVHTEHYTAPSGSEGTRACWR